MSPCFRAMWLTQATCQLLYWITLMKWQAFFATGQRLTTYSSCHSVLLETPSFVHLQFLILCPDLSSTRSSISPSLALGCSLDLKQSCGLRPQRSIMSHQVSLPAARLWQSHPLSMGRGEWKQTQEQNNGHICTRKTRDGVLPKWKDAHWRPYSGQSSSILWPAHNTKHIQQIGIYSEY